MNNVDLSNRAEADVDEIWTYIARNNEAAADRVINRLYDRFEMLGEQPELGESAGHLTAGLRRTVVGKYVIYYEIEPDRVFIRRILHGARDVRKVFGGYERS